MVRKPPVVKPPPVRVERVAEYGLIFGTRNAPPGVSAQFYREVAAIARKDDEVVRIAALVPDRVAATYTLRFTMPWRA